jgi:hypothetical protein
MDSQDNKPASVISLAYAKEMKQQDTELQEYTADATLDAAKGLFKDVLLVGWTEDNNLAMTASDGMTVPEASYVCQRLLHLIHSGMFDPE